MAAACGAGQKQHLPRLPVGTEPHAGKHLLDLNALRLIESEDFG